MTTRERSASAWALVECHYKCDERIPRRQLTEHEQDECPQRPMDVKMESLVRKVEQRHFAEIATVREEMAAVREEMATVREEFRREIEMKNKSSSWNSHSKCA